MFGLACGMVKIERNQLCCFLKANCTHSNAIARSGFTKIDVIIVRDSGPVFLHLFLLSSNPLLNFRNICFCILHADTSRNPGRLRMNWTFLKWAAVFFPYTFPKLSSIHPLHGVGWWYDKRKWHKFYILLAT